MVNFIAKSFKFGKKRTEDKSENNDRKTTMNTKPASANTPNEVLNRPRAPSYIPTLASFYEPWESLNRSKVHRPSSAPNSNPKTEGGDRLKRNSTGSWLKRSSIQLDGVFSKGPFATANADDPKVSMDLQPMTCTSFEQSLKSKLCQVQAWRPTPSYFSDSFALVASEGEIVVDPFGREPIQSRPASRESSSSISEFRTHGA